MGLPISESPGLKWVSVFIFKYNPRPQVMNVKSSALLSYSGEVEQTEHWAAALGSQKQRTLWRCSEPLRHGRVCAFSFPLYWGRKALPSLLHRGEEGLTCPHRPGDSLLVSRCFSILTGGGLDAG